MGGEPFYHSIILNRIGVYHPHDGRQVFYSPESFSNVDAWRGIPIIYAETTDGSDIAHPDFGAVTNHQLPEGYRIAGYIEYAYIPDRGTPRIEASCAITDVDVEVLARDGQLAPSTGFYADIVEEGSADRIVGFVTPNHLLVFKQGACPTCWSNDDGAMLMNAAKRIGSKAIFTNVRNEKESSNMEDSETKGWIKQLYDKICAANNTVNEEAPMTDNTNERIAALEAEVAQLTNAIKERDESIAKYASAETQRAQDAAWEQIKNTLPKGWLGEKEAETRAKFENSKDVFYAELMAHTAKFANAKRSADGSCGCPETREAVMANLADVEKNTGFKIVLEED